MEASHTRTLFVGRRVTAPATTVRAALIACVTFALLANTAPVAAESPAIRLHRQASVSEGKVYLRDVATLRGDAAEQFADLIVATLDGGSVNVTHDIIRRELTDQGVNWAQLSLSGFETCHVTRVVKEAESKLPPTKGAARTKDAPLVAVPSPLLSNPTEEVGSDARLTVRQRLIDWLAARAKAKVADLKITFADRDAEVLDQPAWRDRLLIEPGSSSSLGRLPLTIRRFRGDKLISTARVQVDVSQRALAVVALHSVRRGQTVRFEDLEVREVYLDRRHGTLLKNLDDAIGKQAQTTIREGEIVRADDVAPPVVVRRNELMRVQAFSGGLHVQTYGRALEDGALNQFIKVRNERSRETYVVRVVGSRRGIVIIDNGEDSAPPPNITGERAKAASADTRRK